MFEVKPLGYKYSALEPHIDAQTMEIHHTKHHQAYCDNANKVLSGTQWADKAPCEILKNLGKMPINTEKAIQDNVGGFCNHNFFWAMIAPGGATSPVGSLKFAIESTFEGLENMQSEFNAAAATQFGSGWAWLVLDENQGLRVVSTANQDSPLSLGYTRVLGLDVWEHAYYLKHQNRRADYVNIFWKIVNWDQAGAWYKAGGV